MVPGQGIQWKTDDPLDRVKGDSDTLRSHFSKFLSALGLRLTIVLSTQGPISKFLSKGELLDFWNLGAYVLIWDRRNYLVSENSRSYICYLWSEIWGRRNYLGSDVSIM